MTTTERLKALLDARHEMGLAKYGTTVDRDDLTPSQWCQHAIEELLDGAAYLMRERDRTQEIERELVEAKARIARLDECIEVAWTLIANVSEGNWDKQRADWKDATVRWRDECLHPVLSDVYTRRAKETKP